MRICAFTMVHRDYWSLWFWYEYYGGQIGHDNLFIIEHGHDPFYRELCPEATFITYERLPESQNFDFDRYDFMDEIQRTLSGDYDYIIRTDADELVVCDPDIFPSLADAIRGLNGLDFAMCLGLNLVDKQDDVVIAGPGSEVLPRCSVFDSRYSKAWLTNGKHSLRQHGVYLTADESCRVDDHLIDGIYMLHLKYANDEAFKDQRKIRKAVQETTPVGKETNAVWSNEHRYNRIIKRLSDGDTFFDWNDCVAEARQHALETPHRRPGYSGVYRIQRGFWKGPALLPERFKF